MLSKHSVLGSAITSIICLITVGCGGGNEEKEGYATRLPNRAPTVISQSLSWNPSTDEIELHTPYVYSVKAVDLDFGDVIVSYEWIFSDSETPVITNVPIVTYTFTSVVSGSSETSAAIRVRATDSRGAVGPYETFPVPLTSETAKPNQPDNLNINLDRSLVKP